MPYLKFIRIKQMIYKVYAKFDITGKYHATNKYLPTKWLINESPNYVCSFVRYCLSFNKFSKVANSLLQCKICLDTLSVDL